MYVRWYLNIILVLYLLIRRMYDHLVIDTPRPKNMMKYILTELKKKIPHKSINKVGGLS